MALGLSLLGAAPVCAQQAPSAGAAGPSCPPAGVPPPCVDLDARQSVDEGAGPLIFRWQMGDGTTLDGPVVSHCYAHRARYTVQLDVLVPATGELRPAEKIIEIDFTREPLLDFSISTDTVRADETVVFDASRSQNPPCVDEQVRWDYGDGYTSAGRRTGHRFRQPGRYTVQMTLRGTGPTPCPAEGRCVSRMVLVRPAVTKKKRPLRSRPRPLFPLEG